MTMELALSLTDLDIVRKDAPPADTIARIHGLLEDLGFPRHRLRCDRWSPGRDCHSCHIRFDNYPLIFANGKGVTPELAYASALAEFMERLQCRADELFTEAGHIHRLRPFASPRPRPVAALASAHRRLFESDLRSFADRQDGELPCLPFVDVFGKRVVDLPLDVLLMMTGTSGMCAGNTLEEAITHGLCEVFERHVIHELHVGAAPGLPTVPASELRVRSEVLARQIASLAANGIELIVKDATLGGSFPVVAAILTDSAAGTSHVSFGSDPVFDAALSRCLTEAFQGTDRLFRRSPVTAASVPTDTYNNLEVLRNRLLPDVGRSRLADAFGAASTSAAALDLALERARRSGRRLYVRDCSIFGFPAYYVYVESLSALDALPEAALLAGVRPAGTPAPLPSEGPSGAPARVQAGNANDIRTTLFDLRHAAGPEVARCAEVLYHGASHGDPSLERQFVHGVLRAPVLHSVGFRSLLTLMLLEAGAVEHARKVIGWRPLGSTELSRPEGATEVARWLPSYARARASRVTSEALAARFAEAFGFVPSVTTGGDEVIPPLPLPRCQSVYSCPGCPCRPGCRLDEWYRIARQLRSKAVVVRQDALLERLTTLVPDNGRLSAS